MRENNLSIILNLYYYINFAISVCRYDLLRPDMTNDSRVKRMYQIRRVVLTIINLINTNSWRMKFIRVINSIVISVSHTIPPCLGVYDLEYVRAVLGLSAGGAICVRPDVAGVQSKSFNPAAFVEDEPLTITTKYFGASGPFSSAEDRLVPRRHGADRVEGFPCRSYTVARAHTRTRITHVAHDPFSLFFFPFFFLPRLLGEVTQRPGVMS